MAPRSNRLETISVLGQALGHEHDSGNRDRH
jgi:hypothetical protein